MDNDFRILSGAVPVRPPRKVQEPDVIIQHYQISFSAAQAQVAYDCYLDNIHYSLGDNGEIILYGRLCRIK